MDAAIRDVLVAAAVDVVFLAGYMKKLGPFVLGTFRGRILNTHPALLPRFGGRGMYGGRVFEAVLEAGDAESGVSIHLVDPEYDTGPIVRQCRGPRRASCARWGEAGARRAPPAQPVDGSDSAETCH